MTVDFIACREGVTYVCIAIHAHAHMYISYNYECHLLSNITLSCDVGYFHWLKIIYMTVLMAEDKSRYNNMNTILYETDASKP